MSDPSGGGYAPVQLALAIGVTEWIKREDAPRLMVFRQTQVGFRDVSLCQVDSPVELRVRLADVFQTVTCLSEELRLDQANGLTLA